MSSFSSWGPTDDGRIKPDICGAGVGIRSSGIASDVEYVVLQGTSMSGPSIAGSCLLLVEHYSNTHFEKKMRSATLKGLVLHTADECGPNPGPDYMFGWGLMNTKKGADVISDDSIRSLLAEEILANQEVKEITVTAEGSGKPLVATLCWTDVPGNPVAPAYNSRSKMLVNDLDLRIINESNQVVSLPWKLDFDNPSNAATKGDNILDNVEKVEVSGVTPGQTYKIRVSHKGNLFTNGSTPQTQRYSLIVSGILAGDTAATCRPMQIYNATAGRFDDGSGPTKNYFNNADCKWMINSGDTNSIVQLIFKNFNVGSGDTLYAYSRYATGDTLIKKYFGSIATDTIYSVSDKLVLNFKSDNSGSGPGWEVNFGSLPKPKFDFRAASVNVCSGASTAFSIQPANLPTTDWKYNWSVSGGSFTISNPLVSNPTIVFNSVGFFNITLSVSNKAGTTTVTKANYVNVRPAVSLVPARYQEGFEISTFPNYPTEPQKNWTITPDAQTWTKNTIAPYEGNVAMRIRNNLLNPATRELISPGIDLSPIMASGPQLSFRMAYARRISTASTDQLRVLASTDCGQTWTSILTRSNTSNPTLSTTTAIITSDYIPDVTDYREEKVSLSNFSNGISNFLIKFEMRSDKGNNLFLDNVVVDGIVSNKSPDKLNSLRVELFPNPTLGSSSILLKNTDLKDIEIELSDLLGRNISRSILKNPGSETKIETTDVFGSVQKGIYLINVKSDSGKQTLKWIKQ
jgi:PKD repeat protein